MKVTSKMAKEILEQGPREPIEKLGLKIEQLCALLTMATDGSFDTHSEGTKEGFLHACADMARECERLLSAVEVAA